MGTLDDVGGGLTAMQRGGHEIVYSSGSYWAGGSVELWRISASGSGEPRVLALAGEHGWWPAISRRGNRLAFARNYANDQNIWRLDLSGPNSTSVSPMTPVVIVPSGFSALRQAPSK
jgi:Tol biopolymer transport system component